MAAVTFGRIKSRSNFLCSRAALVVVLGKEKPQAAPDIIRKSCFQNQKLDKEKHKSPSLDPQRNPPLLSHPHRHLYHNQNHQGTTTSEHVVQHTEDEQLSQNQNHQQQLLFHHQQPPSPRQPPKKRTYLPSSEHASKMGESSSHQNNLSRTIPSSSSSRLGVGLRNTSAGGGEIVEVQGGHIVRSTGRKDRHSKVCTAKGPRDRRVRLAAHTAIQFYDVQDRLGYDRPSKAVDWLIKEAKSAIDELAELPAWNPLTTCSATPNAALFQQEAQNKHEEEQHLGNDLMVVNENQGFNGAGGQNAHDSSFLPPSLDSDAIADTIKSFFPMGASAGASSSAMQFQSFQSPDLLPRSTQSQDLRLSLQSFHDPIMLHHHNQNQQNHTEQPHSQAHHVLLSGTPLGFDGGGWAEHHQQAAELSRYSRLGAWNAIGDAAVNGGASAAGYLFNLPPLQQQAAQAPLLQQLFSHNQFFSQRGPLQSSNTSSIRAWMDPAAVTIANTMADHNTSQLHQHQQQQNQSHHHQSSVVPIYPSSIGFSSGIGGFSGFHIPARIQGEEEEHDGYSDKPSSASSDSHH